MTQKDYFEVGAKLIGLYSLVYVLTTLLGLLPTVITLVSSGKVADKFSVYHLLSIISLVLLTFVGFYLLRARRSVHRIALPTNESAPGENLHGYFTIGTKLYGIFVALGTIPPFLKSLANFLFFWTQDFQHADIVSEATSTRVNFAPDLAVIIFGIFLFLRGELLTRWAFPSREEDMNAGA
jgi:hypothetical protein